MDTELILRMLPITANRFLWLNAAMHILVYTAFTLLWLPRFKGKRIVFDSLIAVLIISVSVNSILSGNPFNFVIFGIMAVFAIIEVGKGKNEIATPKINARNILCFALILFGLWYPHFVEAHPALLLLLSPMGIVPCPTLIVVLGLLNLYYPRVNKTLYTVITLFAVFFGVTGIAMLRVYLDIPLAIAALYSAYNLRFLFRKKEKKAELKQCEA